MKQGQRGFTALELMCVVALIGLLAAMAIPSYMDYLKRGKVTEALLLAPALQTAVIEYYQHTGQLPADNTAAGLPDAGQLRGKFVMQAYIDQGAIHIEVSLGGGDTEQWLSWRPAPVRSEEGLISLVWTCGYAETLEGLALIGRNKTTMQATYLPIMCQ